MHKYLFPLLLCCSLHTYSQDSVKVLQGLFQSTIGLKPWDYIPIKLSPNGQVLCIQDNNDFVVFDTQKRVLSRIHPEHSQYLSPDLKYNYANFPCLNEGRLFWHFDTLPQGAKQFAAFVSGAVSPSPLKMFPDKWFILGMNKDNQLITTTPWFDKPAVKATLLGFVGLQLVDPLTNRVIKTLRTDTIYKNSEMQMEYHPSFYFNATFTALLRNHKTSDYKDKIYVYPFGNNEVIKIDGLDNSVRFPLNADDSYVYQTSANTIRVSDLKTGVKVAEMTYPHSEKIGEIRISNLFFFRDGRVFRYNKLDGIVTEETPESGKMKVVNSYQTDLKAFRAESEQRYTIAVSSDGMFIMAPVFYRRKGESGNQLFIADLHSGRLSLRVDNFYPTDHIADRTLPPKNCDGMKLRFPVGTALESKSINSRHTSIVTGYDCQSGKYKVAKRIWNAPSKTFLRSDANIGYYLLSPHDLTDGMLDQDYHVMPGKYAVCNKCSGTGIVPLKVRRTAGGSWEQVNFNIYVFTTAREIASWEERSVCDKCNNQGWLKL